MGCRNWARAVRLWLDGQRVFVCATRVRPYARIGRQYPICGRLYIYRGPASRHLGPAEMIFMMKIWRHKVLELLHAAVEPASRPGCRRSGLKASFESNAHATTVSICGDSQTSSLLRGRLDRQGHALGLTRFHVVKMHFKILKIVCDRARFLLFFFELNVIRQAPGSWHPRGQPASLKRSG